MSIKGEALRYLIAGGVNTAFTYVVYLAMLNMFGYLLAFSISFVTGIVIAFVAYSVFVFKSPVVWRKLFQYPILYALQYVVGLALLALLVEYIGLDKRIAPLINVILLTPITFILNKWFLVQGGRDGAEKCG
jgi:putative flippase GtrA